MLPQKSPIDNLFPSDHIGGHIKGSKWVPSHQFDAKLPTLLRQLEDTKTVIFHCALSKQRGPSAALQYIRAREVEHGPASIAAPDEETSGGQGETSGQEGEGGAQKKTLVAQKVCVLRGGFSKWQEAHGPDQRLTEAYVKDLWEDF